MAAHRAPADLFHSHQLDAAASHGVGGLNQQNLRPRVSIIPNFHCVFPHKGPEGNLYSFNQRGRVGDPAWSVWRTDATSASSIISLRYSPREVVKRGGLLDQRPDGAIPAQPLGDFVADAASPSDGKTSTLARPCSGLPGACAQRPGTKAASNRSSPSTISCRAPADARSRRPRWTLARCRGAAVSKGQHLLPRRFRQRSLCRVSALVIVISASCAAVGCGTTLQSANPSGCRHTAAAS